MIESDLDGQIEAFNQRVSKDFPDVVVHLTKPGTHTVQLTDGSYRKLPFEGASGDKFLVPRVRMGKRHPIFSFRVYPGAVRIKPKPGGGEYQFRFLEIEGVDKMKELFPEVWEVWNFVAKGIPPSRSAEPTKLPAAWGVW